MVGWHYQLNGHEFQQTPGDSEKQESLACSTQWGRKRSDMTEQLNDEDDSCGSPKSSLPPEEQEDTQDGHLQE